MHSGGFVQQVVAQPSRVSPCNIRYLAKSIKNMPELSAHGYAVSQPVEEGSHDTYTGKLNTIRAYFIPSEGGGAG
jgi:hypothetical protein